VLLLLLLLLLVLVLVLVLVLLLDELVGDTEEFRRVGAEDEAALGLGGLQAQRLVTRLET
jgi:hypothetical protein